MITKIPTLDDLRVGDMVYKRQASFRGTLRLGSYFIQELRCEVSAIGPFDGDRSQRILDKLILVQ